MVYNRNVAYVPRGGPPKEDLVSVIQRGDVAPIYCLHGAERYLVDRCLAAIRTAVIGGPAAAFAAFNHDVFDLRETEIGTVVSTARTLPMMAARRLVIGKGIDGVKADALAPLVPYIADPNPHACLVLLGDKVDTRFKVFQVLRKAGHLHEFAPLRDRELGAWLEREARARKVNINGDAAASLAEAAGPELGPLAQALEQLALYAGVGKTITLADVETLIPETRQRSVFELTKAIGDGDVPRALRILANMFRNREPALRVQFMLARQLRQIWRAKELSASGMPRDQIAGAVGVPPFFVDDILAPARRMSNRALANGFERLYRADRALKSSRIDGELLLSRLVQQLTEDAQGRESHGSGSAHRQYSRPGG
ncbi:MAG: DNA polymerase III subunit delta, partial [Deltaproteobacteria bacterium]|nr:DNA polymerase III subunit delta [Deltaproteobacteria bacterium]